MLHLPPNWFNIDNFGQPCEKEVVSQPAPKLRTREPDPFTEAEIEQPVPNPTAAVTATLL